MNNDKQNLCRAKRLDNNQWVDGYLFETKETSYLAYAGQFDDDLFLSPENIFIPIDKDTLCNFIMNLTENVVIYENDIVKIGPDTARAEYSDQYSGYILRPITDFYFDSPMIAHNLDIIDCVIGNSVDNPELMGSYFNQNPTLKR